jgi:hypothetical protein
MVESVGKMGDALGVVWALFEDESGQLTFLALCLLAALALATAYRCALATRPAMEEKLSSVVGVGAAITLVFAGVGVFFVIQAISTAMG